MSEAADGPMSNDERLIYMANQIARNFVAMGDGHAAKATADHMRSFWDPRMKERIAALLAARGGSFLPAAAGAVMLLQGPPIPSQTPATEFNHGDQAGHSDAG